MKILFIFFGVTLIGSGTAIYVGSNLGSGPRDGVMVGLESLGLKIGTARNVIEVTALILGWIFFKEWPIDQLFPGALFIVLGGIIIYVKQKITIKHRERKI